MILPLPQHAQFPGLGFARELLAGEELVAELAMERPRVIVLPGLAGASYSAPEPVPSSRPRTTSAANPGPLPLRTRWGGPPRRAAGTRPVRRANPPARPSRIPGALGGKAV